MQINCIKRAGSLLLALVAIGGCGSQPPAPVANPIADGLRARAYQLVQESQACRKDAAAYRQRHQDAGRCQNGLVQIGLTNSRPAADCAAAILAAVPSCRQWDDSYRAMAGAEGVNAVGTPRGVALMETNELDPMGGLAADESGADEARAGN
jgi:hypothetical protein